MSRIAMFIPALGPGGAERVMGRLARAFTETGTPVDLVLWSRNEAEVAKLPAEVRVIDLRASRALTAVFPFARYLRAERPSAILSTLTHANIVAIVARALSRTRPRLVVREANTLTALAPRRPDIRDHLLPTLVRATYRHADAVVSVSEGASMAVRDVTGLGPAHLHVIYNPVPVTEIAALAAAPLEDPWFQPGTPPVVVSMGRLTEQKDFPTLLRAFALVQRRRAARLMVLGEGEERESLHNLAAQLGMADAVQLRGVVQNPFPILARASVFALASRWEGLPNALLEALACGCPVVSTDCPSGPAEILASGRYGRLVPPQDADALATAILETLDAPHDPTSLQRRAADFGLDRIVAQYRTVLGVAV